MSDNGYTNEYIRKTLARYGLSRCELAGFNVDVYIRKRNMHLSHILTELEVFVDDKCPLDYLSEVVRHKLSSYSATEIAINGNNVQLRGKCILFDQTLRSRIQSDDYERYTMLFLGTTVIRPVTPGNRFLLCPYFILNATQYAVVVIELFGLRDSRDPTKFSISMKTLDGFYILSVHSIAMCVDTYFELYQNSGEQSGMISNPVCLLNILIFHVIIFSIFLNGFYVFHSL